MIWTVAGTDLGSDQGKVMLLVRALDGIKSSGTYFRALLDDNLHDLGYRPQIADPGVWMRPELKPGVFMYYLSLGLATEVPKLTHYGVVWFHPQA